MSLHNLGRTDSQSVTAKVGAVNGASTNCLLIIGGQKALKYGTWLIDIVKKAK